MSPRADDTGERRVVSAPDGAEPRGAIDPTERIDLLLRDLRGALSGLSSREAARRLDQFGPNVLVRRGGRRGRGSSRGSSCIPSPAVVGGRGPGVGGRDRRGRSGDRGGDSDQRGVRVRPGNAGRASGRGTRRLPADAREGPTRRTGAADRRDRPGAGRRAGDRGGRSHLGRRATRYGGHRGRPLDAQRRVDAGVSLRRAVGYSGTAAAGARPGVLWHGVHGGLGASAGVRDRHAHRARAHRSRSPSRRAGASTTTSESSCSTSSPTRSPR